MSASNTAERRRHWERIYREKATDKLNWYQQRPAIVLDWIRELDLTPDAHIIDIGAGDSLLADHLLDMGFTDISLLDISTLALERVADRLGEQSKKLHWYAEDVLDFRPEEPFELWHDRAAFHFLREKSDIDRYVDLVGRAVCPGGHMILGTYSNEGPVTCSGLEVSRYSANELQELFGENFEPRSWVGVDHVTPAGGTQSFMYCLFRHK